MKYTVKIVEHRVGRIEVEADSMTEADDIVLDCYCSNDQAIEWYETDATFQWPNEDKIPAAAKGAIVRRLRKRFTDPKNPPIR